MSTLVSERTPKMSSRTLYQRIVDAHTVRQIGNSGQILLYVDRQVLNEYICLLT
jgi:homoaconitase/3-isopropylmalate dehydratase large subunit